MPEYFLVPLGGLPHSFDDIRRCPEGFGADPVLARGYGADFNDTAYPFYPGPRPALRAGADRVVVLRRVARARHGHPRPRTRPASPGTRVRFGALTADGSTRWGSPVPVAAGATG